MAALAAALAQLPDVTVALLSSEQSITIEQIERYFGLSLMNVTLEHLPGGLPAISRRSSSADLFVYVSNFQHIASDARQRVVVLQVPYPAITPGRMAQKLFRGEIREAAKDFLRRRLLAEARSCNLRVVVNSQFVHDVLLRHHGIASTVLHPPIQDFLKEGIPKENVILSVGRFFTGLYNEKRYDILLQAFRQLCRTVTGWEYHIAGSAPDGTKSAQFLDELHRLSEGLPVHFHVNASFSEVQELYNRATIFWHGAGYGVDEEQAPERMEHFGMTTVEAMSARCIPFVVPRGGPKEVVQPGLNGFVWNSIEELVTQTEQVIRGRFDARALAEAARARFRQFSHERFVTNAQSFFSSLLS